jgi:hypothetical protein
MHGKLICFNDWRNRSVSQCAEIILEDGSTIFGYECNWVPADKTDDEIWKKAIGMNRDTSLLNMICNEHDAIISKNLSPKSISMSQSTWCKLIEELKISSEISVFALSISSGAVSIYGLEIIIDDGAPDDAISITYEEP